MEVVSSAEEFQPGLRGGCQRWFPQKQGAPSTRHWQWATREGERRERFSPGEFTGLVMLEFIRGKKEDMFSIGDSIR